jgi:hypothetical protein
MLKGFHYPLTPKGKSTLNPAPPWYYSADFLSIEFWADASAVVALLPPGLEVDRSANGHSVLTRLLIARPTTWRRELPRLFVMI